jgi:hypothetical protein
MAFFKKTSLRRSLFILMAAFFIFADLSPVIADGMMIEPADQTTVWDQWMGQTQNSTSLTVGQLVGENSQEAFITYDKALHEEKMMIIVDKKRQNNIFPGSQQVTPPDMMFYPQNMYQQNNKPLYWIIPIKSNCSDIKPYHYDKFSKDLEVLSLADEAGNRIKTARDTIAGFQLWPLLGKLIVKKEKPHSYYGDSIGLGGNSKGLSFAASDSAMPSVKVYTTIESFGVETKILSSNSMEALDGYLADNGITLPENLKSTINGYLNSDYCFAVSKAVSHYSKDKLGILLDFKTDKPFYPLYITSAYGQKFIGVKVWTDSGYTVKMGKNKINNKDLYLKNDFTYGKDEETFFEKGSVISQIEMYQMASTFTSDLYFEKSLGKDFWTHVRLDSWIILVIAAALMSFVLGWLLFRSSFIKTGTLNFFLGLAGLYISQFLKIEKNADPKNPEKGFIWKRLHNESAPFHFVSIINKIMVFLPLLAIALLTSMIYGSSDYIEFIGGIITKSSLPDEFFVVMIFFILPISLVIALASLIVERIASNIEVETPVKKLMIDMVRFPVNIIEGLVMFSFAIICLSTGPTGWVLGGFSVALIFYYLVIAGKNKKYERLILMGTPFLFIFFAFFNIAVGLIGLIAVYPYLVIDFFSKNIDGAAEYHKGSQSALPKPAPASTDLCSSTAARLGLFSLLYVLLCFALAELIKLLFLK